MDGLSGHVRLATVHVAATARQALGLAYDPEPGAVMRALLRTAAIAPPLFSTLPRAEEWFGRVANALAAYPDSDDAWSDRALEEVADDLAAMVHVSLAPSILAILAPQSVLSQCAARELPQRAKAQIGVELPAFCARIIAAWRDGAAA